MNDNKEFIGILLQNKRIIYKVCFMYAQDKEVEAIFNAVCLRLFCVFFVALLRIGNEINIGYAAKNERNSSSYIEIQ